MTSFWKDAEEFRKAEDVMAKALLVEIERLAIAVIESCEKAKSFCMGMGTASFHCEWKEYDGDDLYECDDNLTAEELAEDNSYAEELDALFVKYNENFRITGSPMRITRDHVTGKLITSTDW